MIGAQDLSGFSMFMCGIMLLVPLLGVWYLKLGIARNLFVSTLRSTDFDRLLSGIYF